MSEKQSITRIIGDNHIVDPEQVDVLLALADTNPVELARKLALLAPVDGEDDAVPASNLVRFTENESEEEDR